MKFSMGDKVRKIKGSEWSGIVVGTYSTKLTPEGYCVESDKHKGSVQIYPANALELIMTTLPPHIANAETPRTTGLVDRLGNQRRLPNDSNASGWSSLDTYAFIDHATQLERENLYLREVLEKMATAIQKRKQFGAQLEGSNASREAQQLIFEALTAYEQLKKDLGL